MHAVKENYLRILRIELEDLQIDIERLIEECRKNKEMGSYSEKVFLQNLATFKNELLGVHAFQHVLDEIDPGQFDTLQEMVEYIRRRFQQLIHEHGLVPALSIYVNRKLDKVARYVVS